MFSDNEPSYLSAHLSFSVINVKEDSFLMVHITHVPGKFLPRNNLHLLSSVCLCGLFHSGVIYCSTISLALISHSSDWDVIFFLHMSGPRKLKVFLAQRGSLSALPFTIFHCFLLCVCVFCLVLLWLENTPPHTRVHMNNNITYMCSHTQAIRCCSSQRFPTLHQKLQMHKT